MEEIQAYVIHSGGASRVPPWHEGRGPTPPIFVSVATKEVRFFVSRLGATLTRGIASVASKGFTGCTSPALKSKKRLDRVGALPVSTWSLPIEYSRRIVSLSQGKFGQVG
jgi:hypothetical protein